MKNMVCWHEEVYIFRGFTFSLSETCLSDMDTSSDWKFVSFLNNSSWFFWNDFILSSREHISSSDVCSRVLETFDISFNMNVHAQLHDLHKCQCVQKIMMREIRQRKRLLRSRIVNLFIVHFAYVFLCQGFKLACIFFFDMQVFLDKVSNVMQEIHIILDNMFSSLQLFLGNDMSQWPLIMQRLSTFKLSN